MISKKAYRILSDKKMTDKKIVSQYLIGIVILIGITIFNSSERRIEQIGVDWYLKPALIFTGMLRRGSGFPEMRDLFPESETKAESLFILASRESYAMQRERLAVIYEHPISGVVVASRIE